MPGFVFFGQLEFCARLGPWWSLVALCFGGVLQHVLGMVKSVSNATL